jgi:hypothetical protein
MTLAEVEKNFTFRDRISPQPGREAMASVVESKYYAAL